MSKPLSVVEHLSLEEVRQRFEGTVLGRDKLRWMAVLLKMQGTPAVEIAKAANKRPDWVRRVVRRYNAQGPESLSDRRVTNHRKPKLDQEQMRLLDEALAQELPVAEGLWTGRKVKCWVTKQFGFTIGLSTVYRKLHELKYTQKVPRPHNEDADREAQEAFKKGGSKKR